MKPKNGKKICICTSQIPFARGGNEVLMDSLHFQLEERGFQTELIKIPFKWYPAYEVVDSALLWRLVNLKETDGKKIDLVIGTKFPSYVVQHDNKVTWLVHQHRAAYDLYNKGFFGLEDELEDKKARDIIMNIDSESLAESKKVYTISKNVGKRLAQYNQISSSVLYPPPSFLGRYYTENYEPYIFSAGRLDALKRIDLLISALPYISEKIRVKISGTGVEMGALKELAEKLGVLERVDFLGHVSVEELLALYANAGAVYFAPIDEDYGYITIESFLSRKPVVTCVDSGGVLEFVKKNETGFVCEPTPESLAETFNVAFGNFENLKKLGSNGYSSVEKISWNYVVDRLTETL